MASADCTCRMLHRYAQQPPRAFLAGCPAVGCWLLAVGCWLLAVGCWLLAVGCLGCWPPHPFSQRLRSEQMLAVWLPQDSQTSCSDLRRLFERSALARREFRRTPAFAPSAGCPERFAKRSFRGRWLQGTFFPLSFLPCSKKVGRPPGRDPASRSQQTPQRQLEKQANQSRAKRRLTRHDWHAQTPPHNADQKSAKSAHRHRASPLAPAAPAAPTPCQSTTAWARWKTRLPAMTSRPCR